MRCILVISNATVSAFATLIIYPIISANFTNGPAWLKRCIWIIFSTITTTVMTPSIRLVWYRWADTESGYAAQSLKACARAVRLGSAGQGPARPHAHVVMLAKAHCCSE